ncbi:hypothetical protein [Halomicrococcus sp. SG-WS-1]|uniref:hypothetical protein n=1 Tax=Halomicrococcus sp. SG-WS-1 TaxID=3439057 RepID=UPI003F78C68D
MSRFASENWQSEWRPARDLLAVVASMFVANSPTIGAFYVVVNRYDPDARTAFGSYLVNQQGGALVFAVLWTGIVFVAFGPALAAARDEVR